MSDKSHSRTRAPGCGGNGIRLTAKQHSFKGSRGIPAQRAGFCASGCGCSCGCLAGPPFAGGFPGEAREGAVRALSLAARGDAGEDPLDGLAQHGGVLQEQPFQVPRHSAQAALEVRLHHRLARVGPEALLAAVGEQPGQGDQTAVGEQLLLDRALGLAVELLHRQQLLGNLVQFLDAPAAEFSAADVLELYRTRWQVELVFKRFKSLAELGHLPKHDEHSARAWLYGKLFVALLVEKLIGHARAISPWGYELGSATASQRLARLPVHAEPSQAGH